MIRLYFIIIKINIKMMLIADDLDKLLDILPNFIRQPLAKHSNCKHLVEIVMDLGRKPEVRFPHGPEYLSPFIIAWYDLDFCIKRLGCFSGDNRSGIEYTLHRVSSIKNRKGNVVGLTFRVGRAIFGTVSIIRDILRNSQSILLLGRPGVGKTTVIREIARVLADEMEKRVVVIDTSNEIGGDGDIPHPAIGRARRMQVAHPELQHKVMIEAVENHMPEVIIIDEIGTELEASAARTIAERGVQLVGTAHGNYLESIIKNPILADLIGGIQYVTLGDDEAKRRGSQKSILERKSLPSFQFAIEIHERNSWVVHEKVDQAVDQILQGSIFYLQRRNINNDKSITILCEISGSTEFMIHQTSNNNKLNSPNTLSSSYNNDLMKVKTIKSDILVHSTKLRLVDNKQIIQHFSQRKKLIHLYSYGINIQQIEFVINSFNFSITLTRDIMKADTVLALKNYASNNSKMRQIAKYKNIIIYTIQSITINNITKALKKMIEMYNVSFIAWNNLCANKDQEEVLVLLETRLAIEKVILLRKQSIELLPQNITLRKLQYQLVNYYHLKSKSFGTEPNRSLRIYPS
uniref:R3H domain-containing protein n=1 Tax=Nitophyllum punctatum TaxID=158729 RepID=A0A4D6X196_9FLOR|nr:hypothetical protein [Nitophyllum punctatum]